MSSPDRYGRSFADVYDQWYPGGDEGAAAALVLGRLRRGARVLELGVGTGRVALQLAASGMTVSGLDASAAMLAELAGKDPDGAVVRLLADAGDPVQWEAAGLEGPVHGVVAGCNLLLNLVAPGAQEACIAGAARALTPGGLFFVELSSLSPPQHGGRQVEVSSVHAEAVVLISTRTDPDSGLVDGSHIELHDGEPVRLRPWSIRVLQVPQLDRWCARAGFELVDRLDGWSDEPASAESPVTVSVYRRQG